MAEYNFAPLGAGWVQVWSCVRFGCWSSIRR